MIKRFEFNPFRVNTYLVIDPASKETMIVDPGMLFPQEVDDLSRYVADNKLKITQIVNTHLHLDHIFGNQAAADLYGHTPLALPADFPLGQSLAAQARSFGLPESLVRQPEGFEPLTDGQMLRVGALEIKVIAMPGHSPGGLALYCPAEGWVITGDSLFRSGIGRTDLAGGDYNQLVESIHTRLMTLPGQTTVYPGHGPSTTIEAERFTV